MTILPVPQQMQQLSGEMPLTLLREMTLLVPGNSQESLRGHIKELCDEAGLRCKLDVRAANGNGYLLSAGAIKGRSTPLYDLINPAGSTSSQQGYRLEIRPEGLALASETEQGLFYGLMTLRLILLEAQSERRRGIAATSIVDWPAIEMRGYEEDYGRDQVSTMEDLRRTILRLAQYKMNSFLMYIEPDHFVYKFDPNISTDYDRFTMAEIRELVAYAKRYYVQIIPVIELLGHTEMLLRHERYKRIAEMPTGGGDLCPTSEETWEVVANIINELAPAFNGKYFHTGLDESMAIGQGRSKEAVEKYGIAKVYADYYNRLNRLIRKNGQTMMMYGDIVMNHPDILTMLDKDIVLVSWDYIPRDRYESLYRFAELGFKTVTLSGMWDWSQAYPLSGAAFKNIDAFTKQGLEKGTMGHFVSDWGDGYRGANGMNLSENTDMSVVYCGCSGWSARPIPIREFIPMFCQTNFGSPDPQLAEAFTSLALAQGEGLERSTQALNMQRGDILAKIFTMLDASDEELRFWQNLGETADKAIQVLSRERLPRNGDRLDAVIIAARHLLMASQMATGAAQIVKMMNQPKPDASAAEAILVRLIKQQTSLGKDYRTVYLRRNRPINMNYIQKVWEYTIGCLNAALTDLRAGRLSFSTPKAMVAVWRFDPKAPWESLPKGLTLTPKTPDATIGTLSNGEGYVMLRNGVYLSAVDSKKLMDFGQHSFTVELWTRHHGQKQQQFGSTFFSDGVGWRVGVNSDHQIMFTLYGVSDMLCPSAVLPPDGEWHHVAISFSLCHKVHFYVDGVLKQQMELAGRPNSIQNPMLLVGNEIGLVTPYVGDITRLRVHSGALTADELDSKISPVQS